MRRTLAFLVFAFVMSACSATPARVAHVALVGVAAGTATMHDESVRAYHEATERLRRELVGIDAGLTDYDARVASLDAELRARTEVLRTLDASLLAAAAIVDAVRDGASLGALLESARRVLAATDDALAALGSGRVLPAVRVPREVTVAVATLRALLGVGGADGGSDGGVGDR
ncbi:MAG: hypothetical protein ABI862_07910 [Ilumatobacteraceae bacterium]